jgi:hypothetical protein
MELFHDPENATPFFTMKELEPMAQKKKGVVSQSVKEIIEELVSEGLLEVWSSSFCRGRCRASLAHAAWHQPAAVPTTLRVADECVPPGERARSLTRLEPTCVSLSCCRMAAGCCCCCCCCCPSHCWCYRRLTCSRHRWWSGSLLGSAVQQAAQAHAADGRA